MPLLKKINENSYKCFMLCYELLQGEKMKCSAYADELAKLELKWKEQVKINESIKLQLAAMEDQYKVSYWFFFLFVLLGQRMVSCS